MPQVPAVRTITNPNQRFPFKEVKLSWCLRFACTHNQDQCRHKYDRYVRDTPFRYTFVCGRCHKQDDNCTDPLKRTSYLDALVEAATSEEACCNANKKLPHASRSSIKRITKLMREATNGTQLICIKRCFEGKSNLNGQGNCRDDSNNYHEVVFSKAPLSI